MPTTLNQRVEALRRFNRFYTKQIGVLREGLLDSPFPLPEARVIYELANRRQTTASELCRPLAIDAGYLSRILRRFRNQGLIIQRQSETDGRRRLIRLTDRGRKAAALANLIPGELVSALFVAGLVSVSSRLAIAHWQSEP